MNMMGQNQLSISGKAYNLQALSRTPLRLTLRVQATLQLGNLVAHPNRAEHPIAAMEHVPMEQLFVDMGHS